MLVGSDVVVGVGVVVGAGGASVQSSTDSEPAADERPKGHALHFEAPAIPSTSHKSFLGRSINAQTSELLKRNPPVSN